MSNIVINEVLGSTTGSDAEYIELFGAPGAPLDGLSLLIVESDVGPANGTIDRRIDFGAGDRLGDNGFLLLANGLAESVYGVLPDQSIPDNFIENSSYTVALVETASLSGDAVTGDEAVIDAVGVTDGGADDAFLFGAPVVGPDGSFLPAGFRRTEDGGDTFEILNFFNDSPPNDPTSGGTREPEPSDLTLISAIQGDGATTPLDGQRVTVRAVVTVVSDQLNGFFLQEEDADADDDAATSEGVFVFSGADPAVSVGQLVEFEGSVSEFFDATQLSGLGPISVIEENVALPEAIVVTLPLPDAVDPTAFYETLEGMRVRFVPETGETFTVSGGGDFGETAVTAGDPLIQSTQLFESFSDAEIALREANARNIILFEDAEGDGFSSPPRSGDGIVGDAIEGALHFSFDNFKVETQGPVVAFVPSDDPRPETPPEVGGDLTVASFNVLNYFTTFGGAARGADNAEELADQTSKIVAALARLDADIVGLIEIENDLDPSVDDEATSALVAALNASIGADAYDFVATGRIGADAIKQAFIYKPASVTPTGDFAVLDADAFVAPLTPGDPQNRPALAQTFTENATGESFTAVVNHFKSKGSTTGAVVDGEPDDNPVEGSAALTRVAAAQALADWLETDPTGSGDADVLILGDLNAYARERAIQALEAEGFTNLVASFQGLDSTSFTFNGRLGSLDYAFANDAMLGQVTGAAEWRINSLEPSVLEYDSPQFDVFGDPLSPFASSDHDPVVVGLDLGIEPTPFTLEILHLADQEPLQVGGSFSDIINASGVMNALEAQDLGDDGVEDATIRLSSGDSIIPGLFYNASEPVFGSAGIADIQIQNELGFRAIAFGNHEFDFGTADLAALLDGSAPGDIFGADFTGAAFPYLSTNLDFSTDPNLAPLEAAGGQAPQPNAVTSSVVLEENGELIGVVGATTPTLASISSPGSVGISPSPFAANPTPEQLDALAAEIQLEVDALLAANPEMNKIVLLSHMQQLDIERALATRLENVDVIIGGGSNTRLFDDNDRVRDGDSDQGQYPEFYTNAGGAQTALVNTDGSYKYVGRLVLNFDAEGDIIPGSYDPAVSGAYATDAQGLADVAGAEGLIDPEIRAIVEAIEQQVLSTEGNVFGVSDVFLNGNRSGGPLDGVRTQETNLGNLTADANLDAARDLGESEVVISIKNGGGIRASIGETVVPPGGAEAVRQPNSALTDGDGVVIKPEGGISQNDIETTLAFNNGLVALTLTGAEIVALLEHGVGAIPGVSGRFPQIAGLEFAYDPDLPEGARIQSAAVKDGDGALIAELVREGVALNGDQTFRVVTLDFLSAPRFDDDGNFIGAGDGYPFPNTNDDPAVGEVGDPDVIARVNRVELAQDGVTEDGGATFAEVGSEQDALAEYLLENFGAPAAAFADVDTPPELDERIQNLDFREDTVLDPLVVEGGPGRDNLIGGDFSETFIGFGGNADSFTGGGGADRFVYGDELTNGARERFFIRDYSSAEGDVIELATDSFDVRFSGRQAVISAGEDRIYVRGDFAGVDDLTILTPDADLLS